MQDSLYFKNYIILGWLSPCLVCFFKLQNGPQFHLENNSNAGRHSSLHIFRLQDSSLHTAKIMFCGTRELHKHHGIYAIHPFIGEKEKFQIGIRTARDWSLKCYDIISPTARLHLKIFHTIDAKISPHFFLSYLLRCISFYSCNISMKNWSVPIVLSSSDSLCWHLHLPPLLSEPTVPDRWHNWNCFCYPHRQRRYERRQMQFCFSSSSVFLPWSIGFQYFNHSPVQYLLSISCIQEIYVLHHDSVLWQGLFVCVVVVVVAAVNSKG